MSSHLAEPNFKIYLFFCLFVCLFFSLHFALFGLSVYNCMNFVSLLSYRGLTGVMYSLFSYSRGSLRYAGVVGGVGG